MSRVPTAIRADWRTYFVAAIALLLVLALTACSGGGATPVQAPGAQGGAQAANQLTGAGATFPYPLYSKWFDVYEQETSVRVNYQSIGSGGGIRQLIERTVDFGASDAVMSAEQIQQAGGGDVLHIPTVMGAVVATYNVEGIEQGLKLSPETITGMFLGEITKWNDPAIAADNPGVDLPSTDVAVVHRSDGSGTTNIFTDYLSSVSTQWKDRVGVGTSVNWPVGLGAKGNEGVAGQVKQTPGAIGYTELAYAIQNNLSYASIKNQAGQYVVPSAETVTAAAAGAAPTMPDDLRVSLVNAPGENSYPIAGFTWLLVREEQDDPAKGKAVADLFWWGIHEGQQYAADLLYAPLPEEVVSKAEALIQKISYQGTPVRQ